MTLDGLLTNAPAEKFAILTPEGARHSYATLRASVARLATALVERSIAPGDRIAASFANGAPIVHAFFGVAAARATFAPLNAAYTEDEFRFYLEDIGPKLMLLAPGTVPAARAAAISLGIRVAEFSLDDGGLPVLDGKSLAAAASNDSVAESDIALFLHTSGTTSRPKGVPLSHRNLTTSALNIGKWYELGPSDVSLCVMPLFHVHGLVFSTLATLGAHASVVIPEKFSASAFWPTVAEFGVTVVSAVPTIYRTLLLRADDDRAPHGGEHTVRFFRSSSAALPAVEMHRLEARFGVPVIEAYSMTEAAHQMCANPLRGERRAGSVGVGAFVGVTILDEHDNEREPGEVGEVAVKGANVTSGYHNNEAANAASFTSGWFRTGDYGILDERGYLTLVGRLKELINRGGEKISPVEVDEALLSHDGVIEAVAFGIPDEKYGEVVAAAVVLKPGVSVDDVRAHVGTKLSSFKVPTILHVIDAIPKTATGKVQRRFVAAAFVSEPT
jgi:acyl-CoA synthetase (AMP-forming)/AMP-acid ligase II